MGGSVPKATIVVAAGKSHSSTIIGGSSSNNNPGGVFTIPANIPPPPQYCTTPCSELTPSQHSMHHNPSQEPNSGRHCYGQQHLQTQQSTSRSQSDSHCSSTMASQQHHHKQHASHPHFHINPHHQAHSFSHSQQHNPHQSHPQHHAKANEYFMQQPSRCCSPPCKTTCSSSCCKSNTLVPHAVHQTATLHRSVSMGSPHCSHSRTLSPTQHHIMQHHHGRLGGASTPPPRLQRQHSGGSTPPLSSSTLQSPVASSPHASTGPSHHMTATLPRQRSHEMYNSQPCPQQSQVNCPQVKLYHQRSITEENQNLHSPGAHAKFPNQPHPLEPPSKSSPTQTPVSQPSELNYVTPNPELPTAYGTNISSGSCIAPNGAKVQWEGAPSGTGSDV